MFKILFVLFSLKWVMLKVLKKCNMESVTGGVHFISSTYCHRFFIVFYCHFFSRSKRSQILFNKCPFILYVILSLFSPQTFSTHAHLLDRSLAVNLHHWTNVAKVPSQCCVSHCMDGLPFFYTVVEYSASI